jgi:hypothetical protein
MNQIWSFDNWCNISIDSLKEAVHSRAIASPRVGDMSVRQLCSPATDGTCPIGLYIFTNEDGTEILYVGKTHGRSFHERLISHIDHRAPIPGSPHLAALVSYLVKQGRCTSRQQAVNEIMKMRVIWLPIPRRSLTHDNHKKFIAIIERRLLWSKCLNPEFNSTRVKKNITFSVKGVKYLLESHTEVGKIPIFSHST